MKGTLLWICGLALLPSLGCPGPGGDPRPGRNGVQVRFELDTSDPDARSVTIGRLQVDLLTVQIAELVFDADGPDGSLSVSNGTATSFDVLTGGALPVPPSLELDEGTYADVYLGVELLEGPEPPALLMEGELDGIPFRLEFDSAEVFEAEADSFVVPDGQDVPVTYQFRPALWMEGIELDDASSEPDGTVVISETRNSELFDEVADLIDETTDGVFPGGSFED